MDPRLFLQIASDLHGANQSNAGAGAGNRTSITCSYYALFNAAVEFLEKVDVAVIDKPRAHSSVRNALIYSQDIKLKSVGISMETMLGERKCAHYEMSDPKPERLANAVSVYKQCSQLIVDIDQRRRSAEFPQIKAIIKSWVRSTAASGLKVIR